MDVPGMYHFGNRAYWNSFAASERNKLNMAYTEHCDGSGADGKGLLQG